MQKFAYWISQICISPSNSISLLSFFDQVESEGGREIVPRIVSPLVPAAWTKWLNIVFDLNGVLCHSAMKSYGEK